VSDSGASRTQRVVLVQTTIPDYRTRFFIELGKELRGRLTLISGDEDWNRDVKHAGGVPHIQVRNVYLCKRQILWQSGVLRQALRAEVAVFGLNPRLLTAWVALLVRKVLRRRTVLWGHAWSRRGIASPTGRIRDAMRRLADGTIVYTETEAVALRSITKTIDVVAAPNALYCTRDLGPRPAGRTPTDFLFVGRLSAEKKPGLLLEAFIEAQDELSPEIRVVFVGDGQLRGELESAVEAASLTDRVYFAGHVAAVDDLRRFYDRAIASVSPGYVGLSLIQSLGFGIAMLIARDDPHAPEIEAAVEGDNSITFASDSSTSLARALVEVARRREHWVARRHDIAEPIRTRYCIESMVSAFVSALNGSLDDGNSGGVGVATPAGNAPNDGTAW
jgi:glycosyltransferase involved in cell wall biosynthesis